MTALDVMGYLERLQVRLTLTPKVGAALQGASWRDDAGADGHPQNLQRTTRATAPDWGRCAAAQGCHPPRDGLGPTGGNVR